MDKMSIHVFYCSLWIVVTVFFSSVLSGCASAGRDPSGVVKPVETADQQLDAVQKVLGGMSGRDVTSGQMKRLTQDIQKNEDTRAVVRKIIGAETAPVIKYSPVTGKHYSGDLDVDPETGVKLEVLPE
jgi:hypothetical protein